MLGDVKQVIKGMMIILCISIPLGVWKLIEIIIWLFNHVSINVK